MTPYQLTTVPSPRIPEESPAHFPSFYRMQLIMETPPRRTCQLTTEVREQPLPTALPATGKIFTSFLSFQIPQEGCQLFLTILLMCRPIKRRWPFPHPWAHTVMWKLIPSTRDKPLSVEMRREAGSLPGSLSSLSDHSSITKDCHELCLQRPPLHLNLTVWNREAISQTVSWHFKCHPQLPT